MLDTKKIFYASAGVGAISYALSWLYKSYLPNGFTSISFSVLPTIDVGAQVKQGLDTSIAGTLFNYLGISKGIIPSALQQYVVLLVASFVILYAGSWINSKLNLGKSENGKFAMSLTLGAIAVGLVAGVVSPTIGYLSTAVAMVIYFAVVALVYSLLRNWGASEILPAP